MSSERDARSVNSIRLLAVDMVQRANSGHPGAPLGASPIVYALFDRFMRFDPADPRWADRDRFVLSAGHASAMLYAALHLLGYAVSMDNLKDFRQRGSITPGHPEFGMTPGVEATTGPLGQGIANAVGMAIAETSLAATFNRDGHDVVDHFTYCLCGDGDLMEGVSSEAASLAGHLRLGKLIVLYDDNHISIEGPTDLAFTEDRAARFAAFGWQTLEVADGNDVDAIAAAVEQARAETGRPSLISIRTHIGFGSPNKQDSASAHGEPLGEDEVRLTKENLGWPADETFFVPDDVRAQFASITERGAASHAEWLGRFADYRDAYPELAAELERRMTGGLPDGWDAGLEPFDPDDGALATRAASGKVIAALAANLPELVGGSADLGPSTKTDVPGGSYSAEDRAGRTMHFGVREHAMGSIINGMAYHGGFLPFGATFLVFSDYMRPPIRLAALSSLRSIFVFTHDSVGLGEDGPTHQPVEQLLALRAIPNLTVIRPADANETVAAWRIAVTSEHPVALALSRQGLPTLDPDLASEENVRRGAYAVAETTIGRPDVVIVATGSEVHTALAAAPLLAEQGVTARVVSMPSWELFAAQDDAYRDELLPHGVPTLSVEAGVTLGWQPYAGPRVHALGIDRFGSSGPGGEVLDEFGFTPAHVTARALEALGR